MHLMSLPEQAIALLVLYSRAAFEMQEQRMLPMLPHAHPMYEVLVAKGHDVPVTSGTLRISDELGCLDQHALAYDQEGCGHPYPYLGDLLVFCMDDSGPFCVDISIKKTRKDFVQKHGAVFQVGKRFEAGKVKEINRHMIQQVMNDELGIRMVYAAADELDKKLVYNLTHLYKWHARPTQITEEDREHLVAIFRQCLNDRVAPQQIFAGILEEVDCSQHDFNAVFFQAIWNREITPDLFDCIQINRPMRPEKVSPIDVYAEWFTRPAQ
jgi:hypothetical protein